MTGGVGTNEANKIYELEVRGCFFNVAASLETLEKVSGLRRMRPVILFITPQAVLECPEHADLNRRNCVFFILTICSGVHVRARS